MKLCKPSSFLAMAQQLARFSPKLADISEPLRELLSTKNGWLSTEIHDQAVNEVKDVRSSPAVLAVYDVNKRTKIRTDGSKLNGIAVVVWQRDGEIRKPLDCASKGLTPAENKI